MSRIANIRSAAFADLHHHTDYLTAQAGGVVALQFMAAFFDTVDRIAELPGIGAPLQPTIPSIEGVRRLRISGFPNHLVFYRYDDLTVDVLRLLHGHQDTDERLQDEVD